MLQLAVVTFIRNEIDIVSAFLSHAAALFDRALLLDHGSVDGTDVLLDANREHTMKAVSRVLFQSILPVVFAPLLAMASTAANGPSFSCNGVKGIAAIVCSSPALSAKDRRMDALYRVARVSVTGEAPSGEVPAQRQWLRDMETLCSATAKPEPCISVSYDSRSDDLAVEALFGAHDVAKAQLNGPSPGMDQALNRSHIPSEARSSLATDRQNAAALYEAIYRYATVEPPATRRAAVTPLIAPLFEAIKRKPWNQPISKQQKPEDAVSSDQNFAAFLAAASVSIGAETVALPCAALMRRPGLIDVLQAYYGGAIDGHLIDTTCSNATTLIPAYDAMIKASNEAQESCPGTIRFSLWRDTERALTAIRLHRMDILSLKEPADGGKAADDVIAETPEVAKFVTANEQLVRAAQQEVANYYTTAFHVPIVTARGEAKFVLTKAVQAIYGGCERG